MSHGPLLAWEKQEPCQGNPKRLSGVSWHPAAPAHAPVSLAVLTHHIEHGVVKAFVSGWSRGRRLLQPVPGPGQAQGKQPGEEQSITTHSPPIPAAAPAETLRI